MSQIIRSNSQLGFVGLGVVWVAVVVLNGSLLVLWPALACFLAAGLLRFRPSERVTDAWVPSTAIFGLILSAYQVYASIGYVSGGFSSIAVASLVAFLVFALAHLGLFVWGRPATKAG